MNRCHDHALFVGSTLTGEQVHIRIIQLSSKELCLFSGLANDSHRMVAGYPELCNKFCNLGNLFSVAAKTSDVRMFTVAFHRNQICVWQDVLCKCSNLQRGSIASE